MPAPYFFLDYRDELAVLAAASYLSDELVYRFPPGHRLAGARSAADMEPMRRDLFRLFVRLDYDGDAFREFLAHGVSELVLPVSSPHTKMTGGWLYSSGKLHTGVDFNDEPQPFYPYAGHTGRTNFDVHAAATGTVVGWDGLKLLTLEHVATNGRLFRTMYNMVRNVPVPSNSTWTSTSPMSWRFATAGSPGASSVAASTDQARVQRCARLPSDTVFRCPIASR
jgi:hypothetical protein